MEGWKHSALVAFLAGLVAVASSRPDIGGWNDASRLATVECLVDYHTMAIDRSIFLERTSDKLWINQSFYSDKSPLPALYLAAVYQLLQWGTGLVAAQHLDWFCWLMTLASSGIAYVVAAVCVDRYSAGLQLSWPWRAGITGSFCLGTVSVVYAQTVNNHMMLLAITAALMLAITSFDVEAPLSIRRLALIGVLGGVGYSIDLGIGPPLLLSIAVWSVWRCGEWWQLCLIGMAASPFVGIHHCLNYAVGGTIGPANAVAEYFLWPGCPFTPDNMTGGWKHASLIKAATYATALLIGKRGFLGHNLPLLLAVLAWLPLWRRRLYRPELGFVAVFSTLSWLIYAISSNNYSGQCCTIRWLVPLIAPGYFVLAQALQASDSWRQAFLPLSLGGMLMTAIMIPGGPWRERMVPGYWPIHAASLSAIGLWRRRRPEPLKRSSQNEETRKVA